MDPHTLAQALAAAPRDPQARRELAAVLGARAQACLQQGLEAMAERWLLGALRLDPDNPALHLAAGGLFQARGRQAQAAIAYERAIALDPKPAAGLLGLGVVHAQEGRYPAAERCLRRALDLDPGLEPAHFNLSILLEREGRLQEARRHRKHAARPQPLALETAPEPRRRVLIPWAAGTGNVPIDTLLPARTTTRIRWLVELATDRQEAERPPFDCVFNAIANPDVAAAASPRLARFQRRHPMLNRPECVARTRRDRLPELVGGIPGLALPRVLRLERDQLCRPDLAAVLAGQGLPLPLIVRPVVGQGGEGARRVDTADELAAAASDGADAYYLIAYQDCRAPDQHYRKYRMVFVDREPFPYHLAISKHWLVHYYSADMLAEPWKREEERRFLEDPAAVLGPAAYAAVAAVGRLLDLDYAGMDFGLLPDGRVLVFEANATMLVHLRDPVELYPYKHAVVPAIFQAVEALLDRVG